MTDIRPRRHYLGGELAAHLLGSIGEIGREQLATRKFAGYRQGEVIGQSGVEAHYQSTLRGRAGGRNLVVDVAGRVIEVLDEVEPVPGGTITLTIDRDLQRAAEEGFLPEVLGEPAKMGAVVALDPRNGDLLALVSKPSFDPNDRVDIGQRGPCPSPHSGVQSREDWAKERAAWWRCWNSCEPSTPTCGSCSRRSTGR